MDRIRRPSSSRTGRAGGRSPRRSATFPSRRKIAARLWRKRPGRSSVPGSFTGSACSCCWPPLLRFGSFFITSVDFKIYLNLKRGAISDDYASVMELRSHPRLESDEPVRVSALAESGTEFLGRLMNYSSYGIGVWTEVHI